MSTTGTWVTSRQPVQVAPLASARDPQHMDPSPDPNQVAGPASWQQTATAPDLPQAFYQPDPPQLIAAGGPVDHTPRDHAYGPGAGPTGTVEGGQIENAAWHKLDMGEVASHSHTPAKMRDGQPEWLIIPDMRSDGDSPHTLPNMRSGIEEPADPAARQASMHRRWWDRFIDFHRYPVEFRPETASQIRNRVPTYAGDNRAQNAPDTPSILGYDPTPKDRFVEPFTRRTPVPWDEPLTSDGSGQPAQDLGSWGL